MAPGTFQNLDDYDIVRIYGAEYRGIVNYYLLATNVSDLSTLRWNAETSMLKTLAAKHRSTFKNCGPLQGQSRYQPREAHLLRGRQDAGRQEGPDSAIRRDSP